MRFLKLNPFHLIKNNFNSRKPRLTVGIIIVFLYLLAAERKSYAQLVVEDYRNKVSIFRDGEYIPLPKPPSPQIVKERKEALLSSGKPSWAHFRIRKDRGQIGSSPGNSKFSFTCKIVGQSNVLMLGGCELLGVEGNVKVSRKPYKLLLAQQLITQDLEDLIEDIENILFPPEDQASDRILIKRSTNEPALIQTNNVDSSLVVDVLSGSVTIFSSLQPEGIELQQGQRYTYSAEEDNVSGYDPDWNSVQIFLDENNWSESADSIREYRQNLDLSQVKPPSNSSPSDPSPSDSSPSDSSPSDSSPSDSSPSDSSPSDSSPSDSSPSDPPPASTPGSIIR
jgi:hypothetical protein